jgi:hypothetical protein
MPNHSVEMAADFRILKSAKKSNATKKKKLKNIDNKKAII